MPHAAPRKSNTVSHPRNLKDDELHSMLRSIAKTERKWQTAGIAYLAEVDRRRPGEVGEPTA